MRALLDDLPRPAVAPSLLAANFLELGSEIARVEAAGADLLHFDVMDGRFVPNFGLGPGVLRAVGTVTRLPINAHLMIEHPERFIERFADAGAGILTFHVEAVTQPAALVQRIHALNCAAGAALDAGTPPERLDAALEHLDLVTIMTVRAGFSGQAFIPDALGAVHYARARLDSWQRLAVDGGLNPHWAGLARAAGADMLVAGTSIFRSSNYRLAIQSLRRGTWSP